MKKFLSLVLALMLIYIIIPASARADIDGSKLSCASVVLMDANTGSIIYEKDGDRERFPASTTKIMTAILAIEKGKLSDTITIGTEIRGFSSGNTLMGLIEGEKLTLEQILYGMMLPSGNDAAATIAVHIGGSIKGFAEMMNAKAKELGMKDTYFINPHGLNNDGHYTTAEDMAILASYAYKNETFRKIVKTSTYTINSSNKRSAPLMLKNTNRLISTDEKNAEYNYKYATGIKTGTTNAAGGCLVASAEKDGRTLLAVLFLDESEGSEGRWSDAVTLFKYGFENARDLDLSELNLTKSFSVAIGNADTSGKNSNILELTAAVDGVKISGFPETLDKIKADAGNIKMSVDLKAPVSAPIKAGDVLGTASYSYDGKVLYVSNLVAARDVAAVGQKTASPTETILPGTATSAPNGSNTTSPLLFWILLVLLISIILLIIRLLSLRRKKARRSTPQGKRSGGNGNYYGYR